MQIDQIEQDRSAPGNTVKQAPMYTYWCFTLNNYEIDQIEQIVQVLKHECDWFVFQEEKGEEGTPHLQGTLKLKKKQRMTSLKKIDQSIHWEATKSVKASIAYCTKQQSRYGQQWVHGIDLPEEVKVYEPYGWQLEVMDIIKEEPNERTIHWFWEREGGIGKTHLCKYLAVKHNAMIVNGKMNDVFHVIAKAVLKGKPPKIIIVDIPRCGLDYIVYATLEKIKDGIFCSGKYDGEMIVYNCPHLIVFANEEPDYLKMSRDRWVVKNLRPSSERKLYAKNSLKNSLRAADADVL